MQLVSPESHHDTIVRHALVDLVRVVHLLYASRRPVDKTRAATGIGVGGSFISENTISETLQVLIGYEHKYEYCEHAKQPVTCENRNTSRAKTKKTVWRIQ